MSNKINTKEELEQFACHNWNEINAYIDDQMKDLPHPLYSSVDIREGKNKVAPVDHNIYPAGFNNLCALDLDASIPLFKKAIADLNSDAQEIAIIPESNTKNKFYLDHLAMLGKTLRDTGFNVHIISFDHALFTDGDYLDLVSHSGFDIRIENAEMKDGVLYSAGQKIDLAILNNDQSNPLPVEWNGIKTPIHPTPLIGWFKRQKITHFEYYKRVADEFCEKFSIEPSLIQASFRKVEDVDFSSKQGLETLASEVDELLKELPEGSKAFVKASQGTYGMGISVVSSGEEIINLNRKARNKMDVGKNKIKFTTLLVQEGVETILKYDDSPAEVAIYLVDGQSVGGFMRTNTDKDSNSNLNSRGMVFRKFCISEIRQDQDHKVKEALYSVVARLATLASSYEIKEVL
jgi:glutamate--cysteine ligase